MSSVKAKRRARGRIAGASRAVVSAVLGYGVLISAHSTDVFATTGPNGVPGYSTQALDHSYRLIYREPAPSPETSAQPQAPIDPKLQHLQPIIERVAAHHGVSPALVGAVIAVESNGNPLARSAKGARGTMQLMPGTAARYGLNNPQALGDPERNIDAGVRHLKDLLSQYHGNVVLALAAYNAGAGAVARYHHHIPPYRETMLYVPAVLARSATLAP